MLVTMQAMMTPAEKKLFMQRQRKQIRAGGLTAAPQRQNFEKDKED